MSKGLPAEAEPTGRMWFGGPGEEGGNICSKQRERQRCRTVVSFDGLPLEIWGCEILCINALMCFLWCLRSNVGFLALADILILSKGSTFQINFLLCPLDVNSLGSKTNSWKPQNYSLGWPGDDCPSFGNMGTKEMRLWMTLASE